MALTTQQLTTLKAAILAETDPGFVAARTAGNNSIMLSWFNDAASPEFVVWRTSITRGEVLGDGFDFTQVDNLTVGQARIFDWLLDGGSMNPSQASKRAAIVEAWKGTAAKIAVGTYILGLCKRAATKAEKLFASGTGSTAVPATMTHSGALSIDDIRAAVAQE